MTAQIVLKMSESDFGGDANFSAFVNAGDSVLFVSEVQLSKNESTKPSIVSINFWHYTLLICQEILHNNVIN